MAHVISHVKIRLGRGAKKLGKFGGDGGIWRAFRIHEFGIAKPSYWTRSTRAVIARYHTSPSGQNRKRKGNINEGRCVQVWIMARSQVRVRNKSEKVEVCFRMVRVGVLRSCEEVTAYREKYLIRKKEIYL